MALDAGDIMDSAAALLNDPNKITYTYAKQLPYLKMAATKMQNRLTLLGHQVINEVSGTGTVTAGSAQIDLVDGDPSGDILVEPIAVFERAPGENDDAWEPMNPALWEPLKEEGTTLEDWVWRKGYVRFTPATEDREVKIFYRRKLSPITDENSTIEFGIFQDYLENMTAGLIAEFVMKDRSRAQALYQLAEDAMDIAVMSATKMMQKFPAKVRSHFFRHERRR